MQSFLEYRRIGKRVEEERRAHATRLTTRRPGHDRLQTLHTISSSDSNLSSPSDYRANKSTDEVGPLPDLEKAEGNRNDVPEDDEAYDLPEGVRVMTSEEARGQGDMSQIKSEPPLEPFETPPLSRHLSRTSVASRGQALSAITTNRSMGAALGTAMTGVDVRDRTTREGEKGQLVFVVGFQGPDDPMNAQNWSIALRLFCTLMIASIGFIVGFASAIDSSAITYAARDFGVSEVVESLATGLYLIGMGVGALFAGPVSETIGRNPTYIAAMTLFMIFVMASGLAPNIGAQLAFRFLAGFMGSTPLVCAGGSISDLWNPMERVLAFPVFANAAFTGPVLGPVLGGYIASSNVLHNWRWTEWITLIISGVITTILLLFQPETYPATLLAWRAAHLRRVTGDQRFKAQGEIRAQSFPQRLATALTRPFILTAHEPVVLLIALYLTVIYIVLFTFFEGYTFIFADIHGTSEGVTGLCFLGICIGLFLASAPVPLFYSWAKRDLKKIKEEGGDRLPPEFRLWFAMLGGAAAIPISLFWMGWTSYRWISIWSPLAASVLFGYGVLTVFISCYMYIIDSYETYAASALASVTLIRYLAAGGMTVVGIPFYQNMGVHWTLTILGGISVLLVPLPYAFFKYGKWIRSKSRYAVVH